MSNISFRQVDGNIIAIHSIDEICLELKTKFEALEKECTYWKSKFKETQAETYKDSEITCLIEDNKKLAEKLRFGFGITQNEHEKIQSWIVKHKKTCSSPKAIITYKFIPTAIGTIGEAHCERCNEKFIFRDLG